MKNLESTHFLLKPVLLAGIVILVGISKGFSQDVEGILKSNDEIELSLADGQLPEDKINDLVDSLFSLHEKANIDFNNDLPEGAQLSREDFLNAFKKFNKSLVPQIELLREVKMSLEKYGVKMRFTAERVQGCIDFANDLHKHLNIIEEDPAKLNEEFYHRFYAFGSSLSNYLSDVF